MYVKGMKVKMTQEAIDFYGEDELSNPKDVIGECVGKDEGNSEPGDRWYGVNWPNGYNIYQDGELIVVEDAQ